MLKRCDGQRFSEVPAGLRQNRTKDGGSAADNGEKTCSPAKPILIVHSDQSRVFLPNTHTHHLPILIRDGSGPDDFFSDCL